MSDLHLPPLPPEESRLLEIERALDPSDPALHASIWNRVERAVLFPPPGGGGLDGGDGSGGLGAAPSAATSTSLAASTGSLALRKLVIVGATAFAAGSVAGGLVTSEVLTPSPATVESSDSPPIVETANAAPARYAAKEDGPPPAEVEPTEARAPDPVVESGPFGSPPGALAAPSASGAPTHLDLEREVLDVAKSAVRRKLAAVALEAIERHATRFPNGQLAEEREALRVQALVLAGKTSEARDRATAFKEQYADSLLLPSVEQSISGSADP